MNRKKRKSKSLSARKPRNGCPRKSASSKVTFRHFAKTAMEDQEYIPMKVYKMPVHHPARPTYQYYLRLDGEETTKAKDAPPED